MDESMEDKSEGRPQRPRNPRVHVEFMVNVEGTSESGEEFRIEAKAVKISRAGATLMTDIKVPIGTKLKLIQSFGVPVEGEVNGVWIDEEDGKQRIGVRLTEPDGWFPE
jgi:hypothetical protein